MTCNELKVFFFVVIYLFILCYLVSIHSVLRVYGYFTFDFARRSHVFLCYTVFGPEYLVQVLFYNIVNELCLNGDISFG